jgi:hypothetical protein
VFKVLQAAQSGGRMRRRALVLSAPLYLLGVSGAAARRLPPLMIGCWAVDDITLGRSVGRVGTGPQFGACT